MPIHYHCSCPGISPQYSVQYQVHQVHHLAMAHVGSSSSSPPDRQRMSQKYLKTMWLLRVPSYKCTKHSQEFFWLLADCCAANQEGTENAASQRRSTWPHPGQVFVRIQGYQKKATPEWLGGILHTKCGRATEWLAVLCRTFVDHPTLHLQMYFQWNLGSKSRPKAAAFKFEYLHLWTQPKHGS